MADLTPEQKQLIAAAQSTTGEDEIVVTGSPPPPDIVVTGSPPPPPPPGDGGGGSPGDPQPEPQPQDPYDPNFDCDKATQAERDKRDTLDAARRIANGIQSIGKGGTGGTSGYDNREYLGFTWRDPATHQDYASTLAVGDANSAGGYSFVQSTPNGPFDTINMGGQLIPISQLTSVVHNHPSNSAPNTATQSSYPLPSRTTPGNTPGTFNGDYANANQLIMLGAPANLVIGIFAEAVKGAGYELRTYQYQPNLPYDPNNPATFAAAYGPTVSPLILGC